MTDAIASGRAMTHFAQMIALMDGPPDMADDWRTHLPKAKVVGEVVATKAGHISAIDGEALGLAVVDMGGGRRVETDRIDPSVGLSDVVRLGAKIEVNQPLCTIHAASDAAAEAAAQAVLAAISIGDAPDIQPLIRERIS